MPQFTIQVPDGRSVTVQADNQDQALSGVQDWYAQNSKQASTPPSPAIKAGQNIAYAGQNDQPQAEAPNLLNSTLATVNGLASSVPFLQEGTDALMGLGGMAMGKDYGQTVKGLQDRRAQLAASAPAARVAGSLAGTLALPAAAATTRLGAEALGLGGSFGKQLLNSTLSTAGYSGLQGLSQGHTGGQLLADEGAGALGGAAGFGAGKLVEKAGEGIANAVTGARQSKVTSTAIAANPMASAAALKKEGSDRFGTSVDVVAPVPISAPSISRFMGDVQQGLQRFRPNEQNDPQVVGLLSHLKSLHDSAATPGVVVDLKDMHLARQLAQEISQKSGADRQGEMARIVVGKIDGFVKGLKPSDVPGGADPRQAANDLMQGISAWGRAQKVQTIENAVKHADTYKSGYENGLKLSFLRLMGSDDFARFSKVEQDAIRQVAKGTTKQNIAELFGKMGLSIGGSGAHNIVGAGVGTTGLTAALTPFLGPAALPAAATVTTAAGVAGRKIAQNIAQKGATRAVQTVATPGIRQVPRAANRLGPASVPVNLLIRGGAVSRH